MPDWGPSSPSVPPSSSCKLTPGPDMMLSRRARGIGQGPKIALSTVLGMTLLAGLVQLPLLVLGVASLLQSSPLSDRRRRHRPRPGAHQKPRSTKAQPQVGFCSDAESTQICIVAGR